MSQVKETTADNVENLEQTEHAGSHGGGLLRRLVLKKLSAISHGRFTIRENGTEHSFGTPDQRCHLQATVTVNDPSIYADIALGGGVSAAEGYMLGKWRTNDLTAVTRVFAANPHVLSSMNSGSARFLLPVFRFAHVLNRNSVAQSRKNIAAHYDLGNDFFQLFLDPTLSYSATIYPNEQSTLDEAAVHKLDVVCRKLNLEPTDHLLEIGTGWGGLAIHAAQQYGCTVTTTTISEQQYELAKQRIEAAGLRDRITLLKEDYRNLTGKFDKLVSIEMIEAVGHDYLNNYIKTCSDRLHSHGRALIQAIMMPDYCFDEYRRSVDFIQKYIFPGGALPSMSSITQAIRNHGDLQLHSLQDISLHYARTLSDWRKRFADNLPQIRSLGYPEEFVRMWEYYLCYCEGGFVERTITTAQLVLDKPGCRLPLNPRN